MFYLYGGGTIGAVNCELIFLTIFLLILFSLELPNLVR